MAEGALSLNEIQALLAVQERILKDGFADQDEKRIALGDTMNQILAHVAIIAETGRQNMWLNRLLVAGILVIAGAEKALSVL